MSSIGNVLGIVRGALVAQQAAMTAASHNVANANTPGYSRQRVELSTRWPLVMPFGSIGLGVDISDVTRMRDMLLDVSYRREAATAGGFGLRRDLLTEIEQVLNEPSDTGLTATLDAFWNAWSDLSNNPSNPVSQSTVRQRGQQVANVFRSYSTRLDDQINRTRERLANTVDEVNALARQIADMNGAVETSEATGNQAPDLRDERDRLLDKIAALGVGRAELQSNGSISVYIGGIAIVSGATAKTLEVRTGASLSIAVVGDPESLTGVDGSLKAMLDWMNIDAPGVRARLDALARGLVNGVNEYHAAGWTAAGDALGNANWNPASGPTGSRINFFDAGGTTAATMGLSAEVLADSTVIASGDVQNAPGNNAIALALASLRDDTGMSALAARMGANFATQIGFPPGMTFSEHFRLTATDVGEQIADADQQAAVFETLAAQADQRRTSVFGVSIDEELTKLMQYQQAYVAATRVVSAVDEMLESIVAMV